MIRIYFLWGFVLLFVSCSDVTFQHPIVSHETNFTDSTITGIWKFIDDDDDDDQSDYALIGKSDSISMQLVAFNLSNNNFLEIDDTWNFQIAKIKKRKYISLNADNIILYYQSFNDSTISLYYQNEEFLKREVSRGKLSAVSKNDTTPSFFNGKEIINKRLIVTNQTEYLQEYFSTVNLDSAFTYRGKLIRVCN